MSDQKTHCQHPVATRRVVQARWVLAGVACPGRRTIVADSHRPLSIVMVRCQVEAEDRMQVAVVRLVEKRVTHIGEAEAEEHLRIVRDAKMKDVEADIEVPWSKVFCCSHGARTDGMGWDGISRSLAVRFLESRKMAVETRYGCGDLRAGVIHVLAGLTRRNETRAQSQNERKSFYRPGWS
jgi:hypothetical protein